jgi:hypothetical protein
VVVVGELKGIRIPWLVDLCVAQSNQINYSRNLLAGRGRSVLSTLIARYIPALGLWANAVVDCCAERESEVNGIVACEWLAGSQNPGKAAEVVDGETRMYRTVQAG